MDVIVKDTDVLNVVVEYLHSRKLILSCEALLKEAQLEQSPSNTNLNLQALQSYCWAGKWDSVQKFLQPFCSLLENFPTKKLQRLLFRQCFCESKISCFQKTSESEFKSIQEQMMSSISDADFVTFVADIQKYFQEKLSTYKYQQAVLIATRMECYNEILDLTKEVFYQRPSLDDNGSERLISMMLKAAFYEMCTSYCSDRATGDMNYTDVAMEKSPDDVVECRLKSCIESSCLNTVTPSFYYWLRGIQDNHVFTQPFVEEDVQIIVEKMNLIGDTASQEVKNINQNSNNLTESQTVEENLKASINNNNSNLATNNNNDNDKLQKAQNNPSHQQEEITIDQIVKPKEQVISSNPAPTDVIMRQSKDETNTRPISARDSYTDFLSQKNEARQNRDEFLQKLKAQENEKEQLRRQLEKELEAAEKQSTTSAKKSPKQQPPSNSSSINMRSVDSLQQSPPKYQPKTVDNDVIKRKQSSQHRFNYIPVEKTGDQAAIRSVSFHPSGNVYAVGTNSQSLKLCKVPSKLLASLHKLDSTYSDRIGVKWSQPFITLPKVHKGSIYSSAWSDKGDIIATCSNDKSVKLFAYDEENEVLKTPPFDLTHHHGIVRDVAFISDDNHASLMLASAGPSDGVIYITDCNSGKPVHKIPAHKEQILSLYTWKSQLLASASQDGFVKVWDTRNMQCVHSLQLPVRAPTSVCIDARGEHLAVGRTDAITQVFDLSRYNVPLHTFKLHENEVRSVRYHPFKANILMSASYDHTSIVVDYQENDYTHAKLRHHHDKLIQGRWHPSGLMLATTSADQTCVLSMVQEIPC